MDTESAKVRLVLSNCPDAQVAQAIAHQLVERRLAACVNVLAPCRSVYEWQGKVCEDSEVPLLIKTTAASYAAVEALIRALHPYDLPEIVALDVTAGLPAYLAWVETQCGGFNNQQLR
jgi:periplasmic divalent cation tolerance protein